MIIFTPNTVIKSADVNLNFSDVGSFIGDTKVYSDQLSAYATKVPNGSYVEQIMNSVTITPAKNCKALMTANYTIDRGASYTEEWDLWLKINDNGSAFSTLMTIYNIDQNVQFHSMNISWVVDLVAGHTYIIRASAARSTNAAWTARWGGLQVITVVT